MSLPTFTPGVPGLPSGATAPGPASGSLRAVAVDAAGAGQYWLWEGPGRYSGPWSLPDLQAVLKRDALLRRRERAVLPPERPEPTAGHRLSQEMADVLATLRGCELLAMQIADDTGRGIEDVRRTLRTLAALGLVSGRARTNPRVWSITAAGKAALAAVTRGKP